MKKFLALAVLGAVLTLPACAYDDVNTDAAADAAAIHKDDAALAKNKANLAKHRAEKAHYKATGNTAGQAAASVKIGADHTKIGEKKMEKNADEKIQDYHEDNAQ
jgi:hypothetical protein